MGNKKTLFPVMLMAGMLVLGGCTSSHPGEAVSDEGPVNEEPVRQDRLFPVTGLSLPRCYDAREKGRVSPVKNQGELGTCWAFASLQALESRLLPYEAWDFSEDHMSSNPNFGLGQEGGGDYTMAMAYLLSWQGPVTEAQDPYGDGSSPEDLRAVKHVQEIRILPEMDRQRIKQAVYSGGGVQSSIYTDMGQAGSRSGYFNQETGAYCFPESREPNHDVVIVGWDDDYPKENFSVPVPEDGAFLCVNSWGTQFGQDGYFYVSYFDGNLGKINLFYSQAEEPDNYDVIYQSDLCGWGAQIGFGAETAWAVNVFTAGEEPELLGAVGFYNTLENTDYQVSVVRQVPDHPAETDYRCFGGLKPDTEGHLDLAGYYTIPLARPVELQPGERFGVMVKLDTAGAVHPIAIEYDGMDRKSRIDLSDGEGYISPDGAAWEQVEQQNANLCLKAYTSQEKENEVQ